MTTNNTGHTNNIANFEFLIVDITAMGDAYNPSRASILLTALNTKLTEAKDAVANLDLLEPAYRIAVDDRELAFAPFAKLITRINSAVKVSGASEEAQKTVLTLVRLLQGRRAKAIKIEDTDEHISAAHMSYNERIENFNRLIQLLASIPEYAPNEVELQVATLEALHADLLLKNAAIYQSEIPFKNARIERNKVFYTENTGLVDTALDVKDYVKSVFGTSSPQYKAISGLHFVNRMPK